MKTLRTTVFLMMLFFLYQPPAFAQKKYALLITGPHEILGDDLVDPNALWNGSNGGDLNEFWNDTYLQYKLLTTELGYPEDNVYALYSGFAPEFPDYPLRYFPEPYYSFSSGAATVSNITNTLNTLHEKMTENDFLFVWVFAHGFAENDVGYFYAANGEKMWATTFAGLLNPIPGKKVIWMQQCSGGSFNVPLKQAKVVFTSAAQPGGFAYRADDKIVLSGTVYGLYENTETDLLESPCYHGEFNYHMYSVTRGLTPLGLPFIGDYGEFELETADLNSDNVISVHETAQWEAAQQSRFGSPTYESPLYDEGTPGLGTKTSLKYPNIVNAIEDLKLNETNTGIYGVTHDLVISGGQRLMFGPHSKVYLLNSAKIRIQGNATLDVGDRVEFYGMEENKVVIEQGTLELGDTVLFACSEQNHIFGGLQLNGYALSGQLSKATFQRALLTNSSPALFISQCTFENTVTEEGNYALYSTGGNVTVSQCTFTEASMFLSNPDPKHNPDWLAHVHHNTINHGCFSIQGYRNFKIEYNIISYANLYGIFADYTGNGSSNNQSISQNNISHCGYGIFLNNAQARLYCNTIYNTNRGIYFGNFSTTAVLGCTSLPQSVTDCAFEELYVEHGCFPTTLKYNMIKDEDNFGGQYDPLLRYQGSPNEYEFYDITQNCWGSAFNPNQDITVEGEDAMVCFSIYPVWCPGNPTPVDPPIDLFNSAILLVDSGNYFQAKSIFQSIVHLYPKSLQAEASLKELFVIEEFADNDYLALQNYYMTNDSIVADTILNRAGEYLAARCNEKFENWPAEIAYFEEKILNPESESDSLFAIMDLAHTYLLMENSQTKSSHSGELSKFKPVSMKQYLPYRDTLLSLLPGAKGSLGKRFSFLPQGKLLQNIPNPALNFTNVFYRLEDKSSALIEISDIYNHVLLSRKQTECIAGINKIQINVSDFQPGIYFIKLYVNGKLSDTKKLIKQ